MGGGGGLGGQGKLKHDTFESCVYIRIPESAVSYLVGALNPDSHKGLHQG